MSTQLRTREVANAGVFARHRGRMAAAAVSGALAVGLASPAYAATPNDSLQPTIDALLQQMQIAVATDLAYPWTNIDPTPANEAMLPTIIQTKEYQDLLTLLQQQSSFPYATRLPEMTAGPMSDSRGYLGANNPDNIYAFQTIDPDGTYVITLDPGPGTVDFNLSIVGVSLTAPAAYANLNIDDLEPNDDGTYTIYVSPQRPEGAVNWLDSTGGNAVAIRDTIGEWAAQPSNVDIQNVDGTPLTPTVPGVTSTGLSPEAISSLLGQLAATAQVSNYIWVIVYGDQLIGRGPENGFTPIEATTGGGALAGQATSFGRFNLGPDEALIVTVPVIDGAYSGIQLTDAYSVALGYGAEQTSLNNTQAVLDPGGETVTYVISAQDPGVPNWLDTTGLETGSIVLRWQNYEGELPAGEAATPQVKVVNVNEVMDNVPEGTPTVTPEERAAALKLRLFSYNYLLNATRDASWVSMNLQLDDLEAAMGTENYLAVFGPQPAAPLSARLSPELSPDMAAVAAAIMRNPMGSLSAILATLPQAVNDVSLPTMLAVVRLAKVVESTADAVVAAAQSGQPHQVLAALNAGAHDVVGVLDKTVTDPSTSITAGLLNARDDIALQVTRADEYERPTPRSVASSLADVAEVTSSNISTTVGMLDEVNSRSVTIPVIGASAETAAVSTAGAEESGTIDNNSGAALRTADALTNSAIAKSSRTAGRIANAIEQSVARRGPTSAHRTTVVRDAVNTLTDSIRAGVSRALTAAAGGAATSGTATGGATSDPSDTDAAE